eukprot:3320560-Amphidinium_carterae.1
MAVSIARSSTSVWYLFSLNGCLHWTLCPMCRLHSEAAISERLLTGCGLDFLANKLSGPEIDSATLQ